MKAKVFRARHSMGRIVRGIALVAHDGFSARYDLDRINGVFSRPAHKLAGQSYVGKILVLDTAKGTGAVTRVLIDCTDGDRSWSTIGVSENIIEASWEALSDSIVAGLLHGGADREAP